MRREDRGSRRTRFDGGKKSHGLAGEARDGIRVNNNRALDIVSTPIKCSECHVARLRIDPAARTDRDCVEPSVRQQRSELARAIHDLASRARQRQLKPEDVQAGTFTLNNTGATGSVASQPIINQPQAAILTTEAIVKRPVVIGEGIAVRQMMNVCLSFDHRIVDGMMAGELRELSGAEVRQLKASTHATKEVAAADGGASGA